MALPGTVVAEQREHVLAPFVVAAVWIEQRVPPVSNAVSIGPEPLCSVMPSAFSESVRVPSLWVSTGNAVVR